MCKKYFGEEPWEDSDRDDMSAEAEQEDQEYRENNDPY